MSRTLPPPMEKNQKEMGMTLSLLRSEAIHCTRKRLKKKPCPRNPMHSQNCSVVIISASLESAAALPHSLSAGRTNRSPPYRRRKDAARIFRTLQRFRGTGDHREDESVVGHGAFDHPDLLVADVPMPRHRGAGRVAHEHCLVPAVRILPQRLPEDAGASLDPWGLLGVGKEADGRSGHGASPGWARARLPS